MSTRSMSATATPGPAFFNRLSPLAYPLIRVVTGALLIPHGAQKLFGWFGGYGLTATGQFFDTALVPDHRRGDRFSELESRRGKAPL